MDSRTRDSAAPPDVTNHTDPSDPYFAPPGKKSNPILPGQPLVSGPATGAIGRALTAQGITLDEVKSVEVNGDTVSGKTFDGRAFIHKSGHATPAGQSDLDKAKAVAEKKLGKEPGTLELSGPASPSPVDIELPVKGHGYVSVKRSEFDMPLDQIKTLEEEKAEKAKTDAAAAKATSAAREAEKKAAQAAAKGAR